MLTRLIENFPDIKWQQYTEQLMYNRSISIEWIYYNCGQLDSKIYDRECKKLGLSKDEIVTSFHDKVYASLDNIKFICKYGNRYAVTKYDKYFNYISSDNLSYC